METDQKNTSKQFTAFVFGRVQMVMYRDFTRRKARSLGIVGSVQNLQDGSVKVVAQGEEAALLKLLAKLHDGPVLARVDEVKVSWQAQATITETFSDFSIVY